ncbi:MAG: hypothetical protein H7Z42_07105 [Roseiflexaceae bacterium]|nr:hypothetical protein [Roseiflexaceae bacterium]
MQITQREFNIIDNATRVRADASSFRASHDGAARIEVLRRYEPDVADMLASFGIGERSGQAPRSGSAPFLRFTLEDEQRRLFTVERFEHGAWQRLAEGVPVQKLPAFLV